MNNKIFPLLVALTLSAAPVLAAEETHAITFPPQMQSVSVEGAVAGYDVKNYTVPVTAGQTLNVSMRTTSTSAYFNVYAPGDKPGDAEPIFNGSTGGDAAQIKADKTGTYTVMVYLYRNAARDGKASTYNLSVSLDGAANTAVIEPATAPAAAAGATLRVDGISTRLNLRAQPTTRAGVVTTLAPGEVVSNLGCLSAEGMDWCQIRTQSSQPVEGWAAKKYLR